MLKLTTMDEKPFKHSYHVLCTLVLSKDFAQNFTHIMHVNKSIVCIIIANIRSG